LHLRAVGRSAFGVVLRRPHDQIQPFGCLAHGLPGRACILIGLVGFDDALAGTVQRELHSDFLLDLLERLGAGRQDVGDTDDNVAEHTVHHITDLALLEGERGLAYGIVGHLGTLQRPEHDVVARATELLCDGIEVLAIAQPR
jgi:hypothetical protein